MYNAEQLAFFGGADGLRDLGLLESALGRPLNKFTYGETDLAVLAASYAFGIARNPPFVDGNKRTAVSAGAYLLWSLGYEITAKQRDLEDFAVDVANEKIPPEEMSVWFENNSGKA